MVKWMEREACMIIEQFLQVLNWVLIHIFDILIVIGFLWLLYKLWDWGFFEWVLNFFREIRDKRRDNKETGIQIEKEINKS